MVTRKKDPVAQDGAPVLRQIAHAVGPKEFGSRKLRTLIQKMKKVLAGEEFGVAIAAPQVGESLRIFIVAGRVFKEQGDFEDSSENVSGKVLGSPRPAASQQARSDHFLQHSQNQPDDMVFINPEIIRLSRKKKEMSEGCLSVRGKYGTVMRHEKATVRAYDEEGRSFTYHGAGLIGHIFQHETDHLDGILYVDKALAMRDDKETT